MRKTVSLLSILSIVGILTLSFGNNKQVNQLQHDDSSVMSITHNDLEYQINKAISEVDLAEFHRDLYAKSATGWNYYGILTTSYTNVASFLNTNGLTEGQVTIGVSGSVIYIWYYVP